MRTITVNSKYLFGAIREAQDAANESNDTATTIVPIAVDWPELRLTRDQLMANHAAKRNGLPEPHDNPALFELHVQAEPEVPTAAGPKIVLPGRKRTNPVGTVRSNA